jgi:hypothetical protein
MKLLPEQEARRLLQRATEIQAAAEQRQAGRNALKEPEGGGYSLQQIVEAAQEAGINPEYVRIAVAEARLPDAAAFDRDRLTARLHRVLVGAADVLEVTGRVEAPLAEAVAAFRAVVSRPSFELVLADRVGPNPPLDGVLVYRVVPPTFGQREFHGAMTVADAKVVLVTAQSVEGGTLFRLRLPLHQHGVNLGITGVLATGGGAAGGYGGATAGASLAAALGTASLAVVATPALMGAAIGGALGVACFRKVSHWGRRKGLQAIQRLLQTVALEVAAGRSADADPGRSVDADRSD